MQKKRIGGENFSRNLVKSCTVISKQMSVWKEFITEMIINQLNFRSNLQYSFNVLNKKYSKVSKISKNKFLAL